VDATTEKISSAVSVDRLLVNQLKVAAPHLAVKGRESSAVS
jgi:hypothetical protein